MSDNTGFDAIASALERCPDYRILRRLRPRVVYDEPGDAAVRRGVFLDFETTGLDAKIHQIIEAAFVPFTYTDDGRLLATDEPYGSLEEPFGSIPAEISRLTGIDDAMVRGCTIDASAVKRIVEPASLIVSHNAAFDAGFALAQWPSLFSGKAWGCSLRQVPWLEEGFSGAKLSYLANDLGFFVNAHRATDDVLAALEILSRPLPRSGRTGFAHLLSRAFETTYRVWAVLAPFERKSLLKARGYRWSDGSHSDWPKSWYRDLREEQIAEELTFLCRDVYGYDADVPVAPITAVNRFTSRP